MTDTTISRGNTLPRIRPWLGIAAAASFVVASVMALFWAPTDAVQGDVYRILYVHVPLAWLAMHLHDRDYAQLIPGYIVLGSGIGLIMSPATTDSLGPPRRQD